MTGWHTHHPWCNYFMRPREGCKSCARLFELYPILDGDDLDTLLLRHFPHAIKR